MSLIDELKNWYQEDSYPPREDLEDTELVSEEDTGGYARWGTWIEYVYKRGDEYVAVLDCAPATEDQSWGDYGQPDIYEVEPVTSTVVITKYVRVDSTK